MRRLVAFLCVGAVVVAAFFPGAIALYTALIQECDLTAGIDESKPQCIAQRSSVSPTLLAFVVSHHLPRASLSAANS